MRHSVSYHVLFEVGINEVPDHSAGISYFLNGAENYSILRTAILPDH